MNSSSRYHSLFTLPHVPLSFVTLTGSHSVSHSQTTLTLDTYYRGKKSITDIMNSTSTWSFGRTTEKESSVTTGCRRQIFGVNLFSFTSRNPRRPFRKLEFNNVLDN